MKKPPLKSSELMKIDKFSKTALAHLVKESQKWEAFKEGDVLIRSKMVREVNNMGFSSDELTWVVDRVSSSCPVPKKFKIVHIDENGIPWVKQMSVKGGLGQAVHNLADQAFSWYIYDIDPEITTAILLGEKYDPRLQYRSWRDNNPQYGGRSKNK